MAQQKQNLGRDLSVSITINGKVIKQLNLHTDTHIRPLVSERKVVPTNQGGITVARTVHGGWEVDLNYMRQDGIPDTVAQFLQDNYFAGNAEVNVSMQQTVRNDNGSVDVFQYVNGIIYQTDAGSYKGTEDVSGAYKMYFPKRNLLSTSSAPTYAGGQLA